MCQQTWYTTAADTVIYEGNAPKYLMSTHSEKIVSLGMQSQCSAVMSRCLTSFWVVGGNSHKLHTGSTLGSHPGGFEPRIFWASVRSSGHLSWNHSANRCITTQVKPVHLFSCRALIQPPKKREVSVFSRLLYRRRCRWTTCYPLNEVLRSGSISLLSAVSGHSFRPLSMSGSQFDLVLCAAVIDWQSCGWLLLRVWCARTLQRAFDAVCCRWF